ncbi:hypothetical protein [Flavobacterium sp.]|uniref:hypothetical protein n=1 Tax=Flavobacterium sp. TaxID=239 RepID=UPI0025C10356|nr:hypothetical protein [Flavobacterium sp.]
MKIKFLIVLASFFVFNAARAQGCSDAGICSIGSAVNETDKKKNNSIEFATIVGKGDADVKYVSGYIGYSRIFNEKWSANAKVTSSYANGSFGSRGSVGDAFLTANYRPVMKGSYQWSFTSGVKIPFNQSNLKINDHALPMDYQSSLGTFDFLGSVNLNYKKWDFNYAVQLPVININANSYFSEYSGTADFVTTNLFERKPDVLLRGTYTITTSNHKFSFKPNLLLIYHLGEDTYEDIYGQRKNIAGSEGLTVNGNLIAGYHFASGSSIEVSVATPFVVREVRLDGLTRAWTVGLSYKMWF